MNATIEIKTGSGTVQKLLIRPGGDKALFYSEGPSPERLIGHLRMDADSCGKLWTSWWPHEAAQKYNREPFKSESDALINVLQRELFCRPETMMSKLLSLGIPSLDDGGRYRFSMSIPRPTAITSACTPARATTLTATAMFEGRCNANVYRL